VSPQAFAVDRVASFGAEPDVHPPHPLTVDADATAWAVALGAAYIAIFFCARAIFTTGGVRHTARAVAWLGLALTTLVIVQRATSPSLLYWTWKPISPGASPYGPFVNRNSLATWLAMAVPLVIGYAMARHESQRQGGGTGDPIDPTQIWLAGSATLMTGGLLASTSRAGILAGGIGLIVFVALSRRRTRGGRGTLWIAAALGVMVVIAAAYSNVGALLMHMQSTAEQGDWGRAAIWRDTWRMASDFPWTGVGVGAFQHAMLVYQQGSRLFFFNHAHNEYLQIVAEGGLLIGAPAAIAVLAGGILAATHLADRTPIFWVRAGATAGIVAVCVQSVWDTGLRTPANGVLFAVLVAIAVHDPRAGRTHR
jgi:O-antigen ligase